MNSIDGSNSFQPLNEITRSLSDSVQSLEKFSLFPESKLTELNKKLQELPSIIQEIQNSGYTLSNEDIQHLKSLSERILTVLQPNEKFPTLQKILQVINPTKAANIQSIKAEVKNSASLAGLLALGGREEDSLAIIQNLPDEASKIQGYADLIRSGSISLVCRQVDNMTENELNGLMKILNNNPSPYMKVALTQIPLYTLRSYGINSGLKLANQIQDLETRIKAYIQLANAGAMHQIIEIATNSTLEECATLLGFTDGEKFLNELKEEFSKEGFDKGTLIQEFVKSTDVGLNKIKERRMQTSPLPTPSTPNPSKADTITDSSQKSAIPFRDVRKAAAQMTGLSGFFSGKQVKEEPQISRQTSNSTSKSIRDVRKAAAQMTGLSGFFSGKQVKEEPHPPPETSNSPLKSEELSTSELPSPSEDKIEIKPSMDEPVETQENSSPVKASDQDRLHSISGLLNNILSSMVRGNKVSNLHYKENETYGVDARFNLEKSQKPAPKEAITQLIRGVGNGQIPEDKIELAVKYLDITAYFPEEMSIETGLKTTDNGMDNYMKFKDPKKTISLDFSSKKSMIVGGLLYAAGLSGLVGVKEITYESGDYENIKIIFDKYDEKGWKEKPVEVNLGANQESAIDFWNLINTKS